MRLTLKLAIVAARKSQRQTAAETRLLSENRLSEIICGWVEPRTEEKEALARVLNTPVEVLFANTKTVLEVSPPAAASFRKEG